MAHRKPKRPRCARTLIEGAEARGEAAEDSFLLFSVLYSFWVANFNGFNASTVTELAAQFVKRAEEQKEATLQMLGQRLVGVSQATIGNLPEALIQFDRAIASYNPADIANFRRDLARISGSARFVIVRGSAGCSDIPKPLSLMRKVQSQKRAR
jgi:hypothetical protein